MHHYDCTLKDVQYWVKQDGATAKAASPAIPPVAWSNSVQGLTQHFEKMTMRHAVTPIDMGHLPDEATAEVSKISLNHDEISMEYYSGHVFPAYELAPEADRHHGTRLQIRATGVQVDAETRELSFLQHSLASHGGSSSSHNTVGRGV